MRLLLFAVLASFLMQSPAAYGQLTLDACREKARANYPLIRQYGLIDRSAEYNLSNASRGYLPQVSVMAKASYQSEVTEIPINIPGIPAFSLSKDQYQAVAEVTQVLWDGGAIRAQKQIIDQSAEVDRQSLEVALYALNERINQLFFGILVIREQLRQNEILQAGWQNNIDRVMAGINGGIAGQSDLDALEVEQLRTAQRTTELKSAESGYLRMLSVMIAEPVGTEMVFSKPDMNAFTGEAAGNNRPELNLFQSQRNLLDRQQDAIRAGNMPRFGLYLQGGYGKPGLNILNNEFSPFYIGGARLTWNLSNYYQQKNSLGKLGVSSQLVDLQENVFLYNSNLAGIQQNAEISKIREMIGRDDEIIMLRQRIRQSSEVKVENGTLSVTELIRDIQAEDMARQERAVHEMQLLISVYNLKNLKNN